MFYLFHSTPPNPPATNHNPHATSRYERRLRLAQLPQLGRSGHPLLLGLRHLHHLRPPAAGGRPVNVFAGPWKT